MDDVDGIVQFSPDGDVSHHNPGATVENATVDVIKRIMQEHAKENDNRTFERITNAASALQSEIVAINIKVQKSDARIDKLETTIDNLQSTIAAMAKQIHEFKYTQTH